MRSLLKQSLSIPSSFIRCLKNRFTKIQFDNCILSPDFLFVVLLNKLSDILIWVFVKLLLNFNWHPVCDIKSTVFQFCLHFSTQDEIIKLLVRSSRRGLKAIIAIELTCKSKAEKVWYFLIIRNT